jgi:hypothetical protein
LIETTNSLFLITAPTLVFDPYGGWYTNEIFWDDKGNDATGPLASSNYSLEAEDSVSVSSWSSTFGKDMLSHNLDYCNGTDSLGDRICVVETNLEFPYAWQAVLIDGLVTSVYFTILTDLGQGGPLNTLASEKQVMKFVNETIKLIESKIPYEDLYGPALYWAWWLLGLNVQDITMPEFYKLAGGNSGIVGIPQAIPATISTQYLCQVPKLKAVGSLLVSLIVADFVLLQALWVIVTFLMTFFLERRHPEANYCAGCAKDLASEHDEGIEMTPSSAAKGNYTPVSDPDEGAVSPVIGSASASIRSGAVSARSSVRRRNDAHVQLLLASP